MCVTLAELGPWLYCNYKFPRWENFFGYAQIMSGEFVVQTIPIKHINQEVLHFRDISFGINQSTGCYAKGLAVLIGNGVLIPNTVKLRQRYTSVRFKFLPGILANCALRWETAEPLCEDLIGEPNNAQGQPPTPRNHQHDPSDRPSGQGGDNDDPTVNDGDPYTGPDDRPPYAELEPITGSWFVTFATAQGGGGTFPLNDTDPTSQYTVGGECNSGGIENGRSTATGPYGTWAGKTYYKNGVPQGCAEDGQTGDTTTLTFAFVRS